MSTILTRGIATDPTLPTDEAMKTYLSKLASTAAWYQFDGEHATLAADGTVAQLRPVNTGVVLVPNAPAVGPSLTTVGTYANYPVGKFVDATVNRMLWGTANYFSGQFSILLFCRRNPSTGLSAPIVHPAGTGGAMTSIQAIANSGGYQIWHRGSGLTLEGPTIPDSKPKLVIASYDGTTLRGKVDGYATANATPSGNIPANPEFAIGGNTNSRFVGDISDAVILNIPVLEAANKDLLEQWRSYFNETYND